MSREESHEPIHVLAEHWARRGPGEVDKVQATVNLARQLIAGGKVHPYAEGENPLELAPYSWEITIPPADATRRIFLGTVSDLATGQGHTVWFAAALARDEDEFRRQLAVHMGHTLASGAEINAGIGEFPFSRIFLSAPLREKLKRFDEGKEAAARFLFVSQWHENHS